MDKIKEKMNLLREQVEAAHDQADVLNKKIKELEEEKEAQKHDIKSLTTQNANLVEEVGKLEENLKAANEAADTSAQNDTTNEALQRRVQLLEDEAEENDKTLRETNEKLRQTDVKAGHYERKVQALETERDNWEAKYEEMAKKHAELEKDLHELEVSISNV